MRRDLRVYTAVGVLASAFIVGVAVYLFPERAKDIAVPGETGAVHQDHEPATDTVQPAEEIHQRFQQAAVMLHAGEYLYALESLERVIDLAPGMPEARVNAGFALLGLSNPERAVDQFQIAIELRPQQVNAYYGLAMAMEALTDIEAALGAMRTYVHLAAKNDPYVRRARAAIWEWQRQRDGLRPGAQPGFLNHDLTETPEGS